MASRMPRYCSAATLVGSSTLTRWSSTSLASTAGGGRRAENEPAWAASPLRAIGAPYVPARSIKGAGPPAGATAVSWARSRSACSSA